MKSKFYAGLTVFSIASACFAQGTNSEALPAVVQKTIDAQVAGGKLEYVDKMTEDGEVVYDAEMTRDGKTRQFSVGESGELLNLQVFLPELAAAIQKTIQTQVGKGTLGDIFKSVDENETSYDVEMTRDGKSRTFTLNDKGAVVEEEVFLNELPSLVRKAIKKQSGGDKIGEITKSTDEGEVSYDVDLTKGSVTRTATFNPDGVLLSEEEPSTLSAVPDAAQTKIKSVVGDGKIVGVYKVTEDGDISYDVDYLQGGVRKTASISTDGELLDDEK